VRQTAQPVNAAQLFPGGSVGMIRLWATKTGQEVRSLVSPNDWASSPRFAPDGGTLASTAPQIIE
jgi:hypothetical protein